jgi:predicted amidohydrolase YtcJ
VVLNARVYTIDNAQPRAEAFAIKDSKFVAIGNTSDIKNLVTRRTQIIDAEHMTVTPGFIDAHCHRRGIDELYEVNANVRTVKELQQALLEKVAATPRLLGQCVHWRHQTDAAPQASTR